MHVTEFGGSVGSQTPKGDAAPRQARCESAAVPPSAPVLLTDAQAARLWGIGVSKFHQLRASGASWFPRPIQLSARVVRYSRLEVEAAVANMPRQVDAEQPEALRRARIERMKQTGAAA